MKSFTMLYFKNIYFKNFKKIFFKYFKKNKEKLQSVEVEIH
jgi:hypothetical protein